MEIDLQHMPPPPAKKDYRIGCIGAGFIVRDVHLVAYARGGYNVAAICSKPPDQAREVAAARGIPKVHETHQDLLADKSIEVLDIAVPPHLQHGIMMDAVKHGDHIKGILAQKPLALNHRQAREIVEACEQAGIVLAVNQNMRYDQSIRAVKTLLERGDLGEPVLGTIEMRAIPHWKPWVKELPGVTLAVMSIHHLDTFRYLFGNPDTVYCSARQDPRTQVPHRDGVVLYILEYASGVRASAWDDVWAGPAREGCAPDIYIKWRVEGTDGMAQGYIGWPGYPNAVPSTIEYTTKKQPGVWIRPHWKEVWFPDAFQGTMGDLLDALATGRAPTISGRDNLGTMALVEACYRSVDEHRVVRLDEITGADR